MAKSTRSKVKRSFRAKKRTEGVYAATEAARLHRLNMKLRSVVTTSKDEDEEMPAEGDDAAEGEEWMEEGRAGSSPFSFAILGLVDPDDITTESMRALYGFEKGAAVSGKAAGNMRKRSRGSKRGNGRVVALFRENSGSSGLDHLFRGLF